MIEGCSYYEKGIPLGCRPSSFEEILVYLHCENCGKKPADLSEAGPIHASDVVAKIL